ncbi:Eisosome protein 1 [Penicillium paradoxum]|uniref:Eisosome protein 1 n=1 Tax=Penicillium paradoxum TaxID=176176 RepID=UPI00254778D4|nr:Eisosome protein 1 [Penicillium paradoxum]KAJ5774598.1 Eisosome protein 1 [Penicillium paradoxum]
MAVAICARKPNEVACATGDGIEICDMQSKLQRPAMGSSFRKSIAHLALAQGGYIAYDHFGHLSGKSQFSLDTGKDIHVKVCFPIQRRSVSVGSERLPTEILSDDWYAAGPMSIADGSIIAERVIEPTDKSAQWGNRPDIDPNTEYPSGFRC